MILSLSVLLIILSLSFLVYDYYFTRKKEIILSKYLKYGRKKDTERKVESFIVKFGEGSKKDLEQKLLNAGYYNKGLARYYFPFKAILFLCSVTLVLLIETTLINKALMIIVLGVGAIIIPDLLLEIRKRYLVKKVSRNLPYVLDIMSVCVQTGMTIEASFAYLAQELKIFDKDLCYQINKTSEAGKVHGIEKALHDLSVRLPAPEINSFVLTIIQNLHYGASVANVLSDLAEDMRRIQLLEIEEKMGKLSAKMSVPLILLIMFPIVIFILAPGFLQVDFTGFTGEK
ncbi:type II secretion system F family protein [Vibrio jasicida]|jgi:tight adherence protein C|uniref:type II secretion system F family protein n=1 Tax=Vibrio jasicida TaxID=766224 RepID=UPI00039D5C6C|nr:type II secretion system F family protein [Vibrio jasicida]